MDKQTQIYLFYLALIIIPSVFSYWYSRPENKIIYSMVAAFGGVIVSTLLWVFYGKQMVKSANSYIL